MPSPPRENSVKKKTPTYALYEPWMTDEQIQTSYQRSFGSEPKELIRKGGSVLAGPVPESVIDSRKRIS
jgi:hypothetical protein